MVNEKKIIWTIGHSTRSWEEFILILHSFKVETLADVRRFPGSRKFPHFNQSALEVHLPESGIRYLPKVNLGGRRKPKPDSVNTIWRNEAFRAYADYTETDDFTDEVSDLEAQATKERIAYMCSEAVWWRCHRAIISDYLKAKGWKVMHIMKEGVTSEHPYTSAFLQTHKILPHP